MGASQSTNSPTTKCDVFISFRAEDTGDGFTSHLYDALIGKKIRTFADFAGNESSAAVREAIEDSRVSVVVFSKQYASCKQCLSEVAEIMKKKKDTKERSVLPVFYKVDPSDVRKQTGSLKNGFDRMSIKVSKEEVKMWRDALTQAANLSGWDSSVVRYLLNYLLLIQSI